MAISCIGVADGILKQWRNAYTKKDEEMNHREKHF